MAEDHRPVEGGVHQIGRERDHHPRLRPADPLEKKGGGHIHQHGGHARPEQHQRAAALLHHIGMLAKEAEDLAPEQEQHEIDRAEGGGDGERPPPDAPALGRAAGPCHLCDIDDRAREQADADCEHGDMRGKARPVIGERVPARPAAHHGVDGDEDHQPRPCQHHGQRKAQRLDRVLEQAEAVAAGGGGCGHGRATLNQPPPAVTRPAGRAGQPRHRLTAAAAPLMFRASRFPMDETAGLAPAGSEARKP